MSGCDALLHCANVYSWSPKLQASLVETNRDATAYVLREAAHRGLDPIVHVSSYVALLPSEEPLSGSSPPGTFTTGYAASKAAAEHIARGLQDDGAPVVTTYPGAVIGPHDPYLGQSNSLLLSLLGSRRPTTAGFIGCVDVRDVAALHAAVMQPGLGPRQYLITGHDLRVAELARKAAAAAEIQSRPIDVPAPAARVAGWLFDALARTGVTVDAGSAGMAVLLAFRGSRQDSLGELGVHIRPLQETLEDTVAWLREAGHLSDRRDGFAKT